MASANYSGLANLMNLQGVGVNPTSQLAYVPSKDLMTRYQTIPNPRTGIPQAMGVTGMAEGGMPSEQYPMQEEAMELANRGRYGDTTLVHMTPGEVQGLSSLGQLTINPDTGLPEAFNMKSLIPAIAGIAGSILFPPAAAALGATSLGTGFMGAAIGSGLGSAAGSLAVGKSPGDALLSGIMSFGTGAVMGGLGGAPAFGDAAGAVLPSGASAGLQQNAGLAALDAGDEALGTALSGQFPDVVSANVNTATGIPPISASLKPEPYIFQHDVVPTTPAGTTQVFNITKPLPAEKGVFGFGAKDALPAGEVPRSEIIARGFQPADITIPERAGQVFSKPSTYASAGLTALTGGFDEPYEYEEPAARPAPDTGFGRYTLAGGEVKRPVATEEELRRRAVEGGSQNYFTPYNYVRNAAEGGIVGLQQGGMATPQAPSAMAGMLAQPQPQQSIPINVQVQPQQSVMPQQPQPSMPMSQTGSGVAPLPDQQKEFIKLMDMEEQLQSQKSSQSTQSLANIMGLGMNFVGSQYPQTSPSGQAVQPPPTPPMNYGSQVNMGLAAGGQPYFEGEVQGPGDGQSDEVAFRVDGGQVDGAMLSPQEYVLAADVVSAIGNGSSDAGAAKLDQFMKGVRQDAYGTTKQMQPFNNQGLTNLVA